MTDIPATVTLTQRTARFIAVSIALSALALIIGLVTVLVLYHASDVRAAKAQSVSSCRAGVADDQRHATLDLLVATGNLFLAVGADPTAQPIAIQTYQGVVQNAQKVASEDTTQICGG